MRLVLPLFAAASLAACLAVPGSVDEDHLARQQVLTNNEVFPDLDSGVNEQASQHFTVRGYGSGKAMQAADLAEAAFQRIKVDIGLASFEPQAGRYRIVLYASPDEYRKKAGQPGWSHAVSVNGTIYTYEGGQLDAALSLELTHLVFDEVLGRSDLEQRWIREGLAAFEESKAGQPASGGAAPPLPSWPQGWVPLPLDNVLHMAPASDRDRTLNAWYLQSLSMVRFMIERGGRIGLGQFLSSLRQGSSADKAVADGFPGSWRDLPDLYAAWVKAQ